MTKIILVCAERHIASWIDKNLDKRKYAVKLQHDFNDVMPFLSENNDTAMVIWGGLVNNCSIEKSQFIQEVTQEYPNVIHLGACASIHWQRVLLQAGCSKAMPFSEVPNTVKELIR